FLPLKIAQSRLPTSSCIWCLRFSERSGACGAGSGSGNEINTTVDLANGAVATYTVTGTLSSSASGSVTNTASIARPPDVSDPNLDNNTSTDVAPIDSGGATPVATGMPNPAVTPVIAQLDPVLSKSVSPSEALPGETVTWTIIVSNPGTLPTRTVTITDNIPAQFTITEVTTTRGAITQTGNLVTVQIGVLQPGEQVTIVIKTVVKDAAPAGVVTNTAYAGNVSAEASIILFPKDLPATGGRPVNRLRYAVLIAATSLGVIGMGSYKLSRRDRRKE
ncbi:MAG: DUF11 domain-containing protein, partial [Anaerolineae bacterium]|nr:DUF11 domain-containing protein [Anaerolineae bacterium]